MQLLYPIGFLALTGLIIPVLLHLWNVKQGKTLKIGSIIFLGESATTSSKSLKLTDLLLFILRCLIILLISLLLVQPILNNRVKTTKNKGWILINSAEISDVYRKNKATVDSLLDLGFELHDFNFGFKKFSLNDQISRADFSPRLTYHSLLNQLNKEIPSGHTAYLFANRRLVNFEGNKPQLNFNLIWKGTYPQDTIKTWSTTYLEKAYSAKSMPSITSYSSAGSQNLPSINVMIHDPYNNDSKYIRAALYAISDFTKRKVEIVKAMGKAQVVFWLSDQPVDKKDVKAGIRIVSYQKGKAKNLSSTLQVVPGSNQAIGLKKRIIFNAMQGDVIWTDGFGEPILLKENNHFHFFSRFNPQWTDLVWDEQFVKALLPIVVGSESDSDFGFEQHDADQRIVSELQFKHTKNNISSVAAIHATQSLDYVIWTLAFVLLIIERFLSFKHKNLGYAKG